MSCDLLQWQSALHPVAPSLGRITESRHALIPAVAGRVVDRPKMWLANDGNYREMRFFTMWDNRANTRGLEDYQLPGFA